MKINTTKEHTLTYSRLKEVLEYHEDTGIFIWISKVSNRTILGGEAGSICSSTGYRRIQIDGKRYQAHRLAWYYIFEEWPTSILDHINTNKIDNRIDNLRLSTESNNQHNKPSYTNTSGFKGISVRKDGKLIASFEHENKNYYLGIFDNIEEAITKYKVKAKEIMGEFYNESISLR
jgi:hypothetical protein